MKQLILILMAVGLLFSCNKEPHYTISGLVPDSTETMIYLQKRIDGEFLNIDSARLINGKFAMNGSVEVVEEYYLSKGERDKKMFFLDNSKFNVEADSSLLADAVITGGSAQSLYNEYDEKYNRLYDYMIGEYQKIRDEKDEMKQKAMEARVDSLYEAVELFQEVFMEEHSSSPVAAYILTRIQYGRNAEELDNLLQKLDTTLANTQSYQFIARRVNDLLKVAVGQIAPDFTQNDADGNPVTFSDVYSANILTLIDFWASWCGPCRAENPNVVAAFKQYHSKGFNVFGVSLDSNQERWLKAIEDDGLTWQHVSDLKGWGNEFAKEYAVNSIPANFLVNQNGEIVGAGLRGDELLLRLDELLSK